MTLHAVVGARVTLGAQQLEQPPRGQPLARRTLAVRPQQSIKPRDISPQSRLRLNPPLVAKLDRRTPDRLAHRLPRDPQLANDLADRLFIDPERPPDPANRFHRHHPRPRSPKHNQGEHLTIPGVGRYWMLITPRAGSLFHAVFQPLWRVSAGNWLGVQRECLFQEGTCSRRRTIQHLCPRRARGTKG